MGTSAVVGTTIANAVGYAYALQLSPQRCHRRQLLRRRRHRGGRLRREPQFRGPEAAADPVRLREQPVRHPHAPEPPPGRLRRSATAPAPTAMPAERIDGQRRAATCIERARRGDRARPGRRGAAVLRGHDLPLARARRPRPRLPPRLPHRGRGAAVDGERPGPRAWRRWSIQPRRAAIEAEVEAEIADAFAFAEASPFPAPAELNTDVFKEERDADAASAAG